MARVLKVCSKPGCPELVPHDVSRCHEHERAADRARGSRQARGYDREHDRLRRRYERRGVVGMTCPRCGQPILPGQPWDLGHTDDRTGWTGPEHARCNRSAGGRAAHT